MGMKKYTPNRARFFFRAQEIYNFQHWRKVALRSVNNIFPESYDFVAIPNIERISTNNQIVCHNQNYDNLLIFLQMSKFC
jgi:hypothetical protein